MRLPAATDLESRDGTLTKGSLVTNGFIEGQNMPKVRKRPGMSAYGLVKTGTAQVLANWYGIKSVIGDYYVSGLSYSSGYTNNTTWNSADKTANVTLSGGDLTVATTAVGFGGVRSVASKSSGVWYYEITVNTVGVTGVGFSNSTHSLSFADFTGYCIFLSDGNISNQLGGSGGFGATYTNADIIGCLYDIRCMYKIR